MCLIRERTSQMSLPPVHDQSQFRDMLHNVFGLPWTAFKHLRRTLTFFPHFFLWEWEAKHFRTKDTVAHTQLHHILFIPWRSLVVLRASFLEEKKQQLLLKKGKCGKTSSSLPTLCRTLSPKFSPSIQKAALNFLMA